MTDKAKAADEYVAMEDGQYNRRIVKRGEKFRLKPDDTDPPKWAQPYTPAVAEKAKAAAKPRAIDSTNRTVRKQKT